MSDEEIMADLEVLAGKYSGDVLGNGAVIASILYTVLGCLAIGGTVIFQLAKICVEFSKMCLSQMEYDEWIEKG